MTAPHRHHRCTTDVIHHVICRHRVEVEVWPPRVPVSFQDERFVNPINTQARFEATVYNSTEGVRWEVRKPGGASGVGTIDQTGLYRAPPKGFLPSGTTDIVVATSTEDPLRKAVAWVTLIGVGPAPDPVPTIEIWPKSAFLYYPSNLISGTHRNEYIDVSNKMQVFRARIRDGDGAQVEWLVDGMVKPNSPPYSHYRYEVTGSGSTKEVVVTARIKSQTTIFDQALVVVSNYTWPKMQEEHEL